MKPTIPTAHIGATDKSQIAKTVLMPGDPLRAKFIADNFLENVVQYNAVRGMLGFTGTYKGKPVSVQGSGMGAPSIGIYSYELFKFYDVDNIMRVGTAGSFSHDVNIKDVILASGASTNSSFVDQYRVSGTYAPIASYELLEVAVAESRKKGVNFKVGNVLTSDVFYGMDDAAVKAWQSLNVLAVEMEAAALYMNAAHLGKKALTILTISDSIVKGEATTAEEREKTFTDMMEIALETAIKV